MDRIGGINGSGIYFRIVRQIEYRNWLTYPYYFIVDSSKKMFMKVADPKLLSDFLDVEKRQYCELGSKAIAFNGRFWEMKWNYKNTEIELAYVEINDGKIIKVEWGNAEEIIKKIKPREADLSEIQKTVLTTLRMVKTGAPRGVSLIELSTTTGIRTERISEVLSELRFMGFVIELREGYYEAVKEEYLKGVQ